MQFIFSKLLHQCDTAVALLKYYSKQLSIYNLGHFTKSDVRRYINCRFLIMNDFECTNALIFLADCIMSFKIEINIKLNNNQY